jgi:hypothetical protein
LLLLCCSSPFSFYFSLGGGKEEEAALGQVMQTSESWVWGLDAADYLSKGHLWLHMPPGEVNATQTGSGKPSVACKTWVCGVLSVEHTCSNSLVLQVSQILDVHFNILSHLFNVYHFFMIFTFGCCILLHIYPTGSLWRRQSQQSFNTSTPSLFSFSLHVSAPTGHLQVRYTIRYF